MPKEAVKSQIGQPSIAEIREFYSKHENGDTNMKANDIDAMK
jgi:hypothetical protein